jgi:adenine-specific DNA methylase
MTPKFVLPMLIFGMVVGISISTSAQTVKATEEASTERPFLLAQTTGMERRQDRRAIRQDYRQQNGFIGATANASAAGRGLTTALTTSEGLKKPTRTLSKSVASQGEARRRKQVTMHQLGIRARRLRAISRASHKALEG